MKSVALSLKTIINGSDLLKISVIIKWDIWKKYLLLLATKLLEKIADPSNGKICYNSYLKRKNKKLVKLAKIITEQQKAIENPNIADIKSVIIEHPKISHKLYKTIKVSEDGAVKNSNIPLYSEAKQKWKAFGRKKFKDKKAI